MSRQKDSPDPDSMPGVVSPARSDGVTRRDFIHDLSLAALAVGMPGLAKASPDTVGAAAGPQATAERYYPPTLTGMRGSHPGAFETAHALAREGREFPPPRDTGEEYDLVVVGAGISGLAAAYFYRQQHGADTRILLLDNHDDFGGHARRNEFHQGGPMRLAWGGTVNIEHWKYSDVGNRLLREIGVDIDRLLADFEYDWGSSGTGLAEAVFFDEASYGRDALLAGMTSLSRENLLAMGERIPISAAGRQSLLRFAAAEGDLLANLAEGERERLLHGTRYTDFLREHGRLTDDAIQIFGNSTVGIWGVPAWEMSVAEGLETGLPGAHILGVDPAEFEDDEHLPSAMFPDGNASIARLLVRQLIPAAFPGMEADTDPFSIVTADLDYGELDRPSSPARLRLNATVLRVANRDGGVDVHYARAGTLHAVRARQCIMACYNRIIPHLCPELPEQQKAGLAQCIKRPMGTINVELRNGHAIEESGVASASLPGSMLGQVAVVNGINAGPYRSEWNPDEPCVLHFFFGIGAEDPTGLDIVEQSQAGRLRLLAMSFDDFETEVHRILTGIWGPSGLDVERDILAITVNRWPHGYARDLIDLEDPAWLASPGPYEIGRRPCGNIAIANSDAGADAYTHTAIDQAWRAVNDLPARSA